MGSAQTGRRIDAATEEGSDHRAEFQNLQAVQMGSQVVGSHVLCRPVNI